MTKNPFRGLPSVDELLRLANEADEQVLATSGHAAAVATARDVLEAERSRLARGSAGIAPVSLAEELVGRLAVLSAPSLRRVINATGVILQTNLGRAPLSEATIEAMSAVARGYSNLEYDIETGARGSRHEHVRELLRRATGAEDGIVVNNNAAALFMVLQVFAQSREVIVSRGEAVEIGGGFRIPDVLRQSGAILVEVGTTNRTYARDYASALGENTAAILKVHSSNFRIVGFTASPALSELRTVATQGEVLLFDDLGSGALLPTEQFGMAHEPMVQESLAAGADLVLFSGDKLLGGPQAGIIVGRGDLVARLRSHPLARALRVDKLTIAGLNATLAAYVRGHATDEIPVWKMIAASSDGLGERAASYASADPAGTVGEARSMVGGGSIPEEGVATPVARFAVEHPTALARTLRGQDPPVIARIESEQVVVDPRTVDSTDDVYVVAALRSAIRYTNNVDLENRRDV